MATKTKCQICGVKLMVPAGAQSFRCPVCQQNNKVQTFNFRPLARPLGPQAPLRPPPMQARKKALLCGLSYHGQKHWLKGSVNDVNYMKYFLERGMGFPSDCIITLTEYEKDLRRIPTKRNMLMALEWLVQGCSPGSSLVFYYTGHGSRVMDTNWDEIDGYDEALCPVDYETAGKLIDDDIKRIIVNPLPRGAKLHAIIDTCFSGTALDLPFVCRFNRGGYQYNWEDHALYVHSHTNTQGGLAVCISACADDESALATTAFTGNSTGALTYSFIQAVQSAPGLTYGRLLYSIRKLINEAHANAPADTISGDPLLSSSELFDIHSRQFLL